MNQKSIKAMVSTGLLSLKNEALPVSNLIEAVKPFIVVTTTLPVIELVAHFQLMFFVKVIEGSLSVYFGILWTFEKGHVLSVLTVYQASYAVNRKGHRSL
jgi:hypothetical protein